MSNPALRFYRMVSLAMAAIFAAVGLVFLFLPDQALGFFNRLSAPLGLPPAPLHSAGFYPILAAAYMYLVTWLAACMFKKPSHPVFPQLLTQGKLASSLFSLIYFFYRAPYLVCLANAVADGFVAALVLRLYFLQKKYRATWST